MKISDDDSSVAEEQVEPVRATSTSQPSEGDETKRQGVRELVDLLNKQSANAGTNKTNATRGGHRRAQPKRQSSAPARVRKKSKSPERPERAILDPMRIMTSPLRMRPHSVSPDRDWRRGDGPSTKHYVDIPSPREGSPKTSISRSASADSKPFLSEIYENPKRRPLSDIIRQFSGDTDAPKVHRSHSSPPQRKGSKLGGRPLQTREGSPPRFGEKLGSRVSVIDDDMFRKEGSIRMAKGKGKRIGWTDRTDESGDSLDNLDDDSNLGRGRRKKRGPVKEEEIKAQRPQPRNSSAPVVLTSRKSRSDSRSSRSGDDAEESMTLEDIARSRSPAFDTFEGKLLASTPVESVSSLSPEFLVGSPFSRDDPTRRSYDESSLIAEKEFRNEPNFELRRRPSPKHRRKSRGKYEVQPDTPPQKRSRRELKSRSYSSSNESDQEVSMNLGSEMDSRSEASSIDLSPVAGVSQ